jgi:chromate transporter
MSSSTNTATGTNTDTPTLAQAIVVWARIGVLSFGGPAAQIALMHRIIVEEHRWLDEKQYLNALSFCMLLPGPEAMQLATYAGWRLHGVAGGLAAGLLFVLPGALVVLLLAAVYAIFGDVSWITSLFFGIKAAVIVIVFEALLRMARRALVRTVHWIIAALSFVGIFFLELPYPLIILLAALFGFSQGEPTEQSAETLSSPGSMLSRTVITVFVWLLIWWLPLLLLKQFAVTDILIDIGQFFSTLAVVTFGGAYAVLAYLAQDVVNQFGWLTAGEMMDGLGLAETTPGPLILVTEFAGFIAAFREGGLSLGLAGAAVTLWVTFVPCFLWIFAGAPYIEWISAQPRLREALAAITAAVVGVILNLSIWFGLHVFFSVVEPRHYGVLKLWVPEWATLDWRVIALSTLCAILAFVYHWSISRILLLASLLGVVLMQFV